MTVKLDYDIEDAEEVVSFDIIDDFKTEHKDERSYTESCFQNFSLEEGTTNKPIRRVYCVDNSEPEITHGEIVAIFNYKPIKAKGRKNHLAGHDVLHISLPTGSLRIPLDEAKQFGKYLISIAHAMENSSSQTNDNLED